MKWSLCLPFCLWLQKEEKILISRHNYKWLGHTAWEGHSCCMSKHNHNKHGGWLYLSEAAARFLTAGLAVCVGVLASLVPWVLVCNSFWSGSVKFTGAAAAALATWPTKGLPGDRSEGGPTSAEVSLFSKDWSHSSKVELSLKRDFTEFLVVSSSRAARRLSSRPDPSELPGVDGSPQLLWSDMGDRISEFVSYPRSKSSVNLLTSLGIDTISSLSESGYYKM